MPAPCLGASSEHVLHNTQVLLDGLETGIEKILNFQGLLKLVKEGGYAPLIYGSSACD